MGKVYRRKKKSCAICKPNKVGWEPARTVKERSLEKAQEEEIEEESEEETTD